MKHKKGQEYLIVSCGCGRIHYIGLVRAGASTPMKPRAVTCPKSGKERVYQPDEIVRTAIPPQ